MITLVNTDVFILRSRFCSGFVCICEPEFAIYLEKGETRYMLIASPLAPRSTRCAAAIC